jgi:NAD(P)H-quinone oxidoreductase subunit 6
MLVNKKEKLKPIEGLITRKLLSGGICGGLLILLLRVSITTKWSLPGPTSIGEEATDRIGEHLFTDYLLPFELASILLLMAMIGAIVLARRDISSTEDKVKNLKNQKSLIEKKIPLLSENSLK